MLTPQPEFGVSSSKIANWFQKLNTRANRWTHISCFSSNLKALSRQLFSCPSEQCQHVETYVAVTSAAAAAAAGQGGVRGGGISAKCLKMVRTSRG